MLLVDFEAFLKYNDDQQCGCLSTSQSSELSPGYIYTRIIEKQKFSQRIVAQLVFSKSTSNLIFKYVHRHRNLLSVISLVCFSSGVTALVLKHVYIGGVFISIGQGIFFFFSLCMHTDIAWKLLTQFDIFYLVVIIIPSFMFCQLYLAYHLDNISLTATLCRAFFQYPWVAFIFMVDAMPCTLFPSDFRRGFFLLLGALFSVFMVHFWFTDRDDEFMIELLGTTFMVKDLRNSCFTTLVLFVYQIGVSSFL